MIYFTSDLHLFHANIIKYCNRPFETVSEMNDKIIENWNKTIKNKSDIVYILGDVSFGHPRHTLEILNKLNGTKILIKGNHDKNCNSIAHAFLAMRDYYEIYCGQIPIIMFHYPLETWNKSHIGSIHLHGHTHNLDNLFHSTYKRNRFNVGVDVNNFTPLSLDQIMQMRLEQIKERL